MVVEFQLGRAVPLQLEVAFARTTDHFDLPGDLEVVTGTPPEGDRDGARSTLRFDAAPYGEHEGGGIVTLLPADWLRAGKNRVALSMRRVDFPGVAFELASLRISTGSILPDARKTFEAAQEAQSRKRREAEHKGEVLRHALTSIPYRVAVEDSLHKLFLDELQLLSEECREGAEGRPWSMRRSRLTGRFLPSLLADKQPELLLEACRGEQESGQVVVVPCTSDLHRVTVKCDGLRGPEGRAIRPDHIELRVVGYVKTKRPRYDHEYLGWWPDVLLPSFAFDVFVGQVQPVWVTIQVPPDALPGEYVGHVEVAPSGPAPIRVPIKLRVWDFALPRESFLQTAVDLGTGWISRFYERHPEANEDGLSAEDIYHNFLRTLLSLRMSPFTLGQDAGLIRASTDGDGRKSWDYARLDRALELALDNGLTRFAAGTVFNNDLLQADRQEELIDLFAHLVRKGWFDRAYYYGIDEGSGNIRKVYELAKRLIPGVRTLTTVTHRDESLEKAVDIYVPRTVDDWGAYYGRGIPERLRGMDKEYWVYTSGYPAPPVWPQVYVDCPAIDQRIIPWTCARWGMTGYLKVPLTSWYHMEGKRMDYRKVRTQWDVNPGIYGDSNGEILMLYCGPKGQMMPSLRLALLRDGIEDYDYHAILTRYAVLLRERSSSDARDALVVAEEALDLSGLIIRPFQFPRRPHVDQLVGRRRLMAEAIVAARRALGSKSDPQPAPPPSRRQGPLWCAAVQSPVNNVRPTSIPITLVNQSGKPFSTTLRAAGPEGWRLEPDSWQLEFEQDDLKRIQTHIVLDENADFSDGESLVTFSAKSGGGTHTFSVPIVGVRCRGFRTVGPFKQVLSGTKVKPLPPEIKIDHRGVYKDARGGKARWRDLLLPCPGIHVDFDRIYGTPPTKYVPQSPRENYSNVAFALSYVFSEEERSLLLKLAGPNRMRVWLNGKPVFGGLDEDFDAAEDEDAGDDDLGMGLGPGEKDAGSGEVMGPSQKAISLNGGWNTLLLRVEKSVGKVVGDWSVGIQILDREVPAKGLLWRLEAGR